MINLLEKYIEIIKPDIIDLFKDDSSGHDISHLIRVMNIAVKLSEMEDGDKLVIGIAAFMHDIHRIMQNESGKYFSPKESIPTVREILDNTDLEDSIKDKICYCIEYHEEYNWNGNNVEDINTLILQDADNLDAIGAIGIGRAFTYGGARNIKMYDESIPLDLNNNFTDAKDDITTIHHFYHKLFKLSDNMNTNAAKHMAIERCNYMRSFVKEFMDEWNGLK